MSEIFKKIEKYWWGGMDDDCLDIPLTDVNQVNIFGDSPIHMTALRGDAEDIQWLIDNGANINHRGDYGMTPLHYAYMGGNKKNIKILLDAGADESIRCDRGLLPREYEIKVSS